MTSTTGIWGTLTGYTEGTPLRAATAAEWRASANKLAEGDPANGAFDGADGFEPHVTVFVEGGPDADVTEGDIRDLRDEAGPRDAEQVRLCDEALGDRHGPAWYACAMVILDNRANVAAQA